MPVMKYTLLWSDQTMRRILSALLTSALLAAPVSVTVSHPAFAQGVPVNDPLQIAKFKALIDQAKAQITKLTNIDNLLDDQTKKMIQQIALLKNQIDALRNGLTLADLGIDKNFLRDILPNTSDLTVSIGAAKSGKWGSVLTGGKVGSTPTGTVVEKIFNDSGMTGAQVTALAESGDKGAQIIANQANTGAFLSVAAQQSSTRAAESLERVDELVNKIPTTAGLKEAIDLNTRVTAELSIAMANIWSMEAVQTVGQGEMGVMDAATAATEEKYLSLVK